MPLGPEDAQPGAHWAAAPRVPVLPRAQPGSAGKSSTCRLGLGLGPGGGAGGGAGGGGEHTHDNRGSLVAQSFLGPAPVRSHLLGVYLLTVALGKGGSFVCSTSSQQSEPVSLPGLVTHLQGTAQNSLTTPRTTGQACWGGARPKPQALVSSQWEKRTPWAPQTLLYSLPCHTASSLVPALARAAPPPQQPYMAHHTRSLSLLASFCPRSALCLLLGVRGPTFKSQLSQRPAM